MLTPALDPLFIAYNTGADGGILRTICIVRKYFTQQEASNALFGSFPVKNYPKEPFRGSLRVNFCRRCCWHPYWAAILFSSTLGTALVTFWPIVQGSDLAAARS